MDKLMELAVYAVVFFCGCAAGIQYTDYIKNRNSKDIAKQIEIPSEFIISNDKDIAELDRIKVLKKFIENLDIDTYTKERILKEISSEVRYAESKIYEKLGKKAYEKEFIERKANL